MAYIRIWWKISQQNQVFDYKILSDGMHSSRNWTMLLIGGIKVSDSYFQITTTLFLLRGEIVRSNEYLMFQEIVYSGMHANFWIRVSFLLQGN